MVREENIPGVGKVHILFERPVSNNPADDYLTYVMAYTPESKYPQYITWMYNKSFTGYNLGHYFPADEDKEEAYSKAYLDYKNR
jgi:hypothetical protein